MIRDFDRDRDRDGGGDADGEPSVDGDEGADGDEGGDEGGTEGGACLLGRFCEIFFFSRGLVICRISISTYVRWRYFAILLYHFGFLYCDIVVSFYCECKLKRKTYFVR